MANLVPKVDNTGSIGTSSKKWSNVHSTTLTVAAQASALSLNSQKITNLGTPTADADAATKAYVDGIAQGISAKDSVRVATTANGTLSSAYANGQSVDGVTLATGDRVLVKNQTSGAENGIYTVNASGAPTRAVDFDANAEVAKGAYVFVEEGTTNANAGFVLTTDGSITLGSTALAFTQFSGAGQITAGDGISKSGNTLAVDIPNTTAMTGDIVDTDELLVSDGGALRRADFSVVRDAVFNDISGDATVAAGGALTISSTAITGQNAETNIADGDLILISDASDSGNLKKMTKANFVAGLGAASAINDLSDVTITSAANTEYLRHNGSAWVDAALSIVDDTTPQLGGNLDVNGKDITSVSNGNITLTPNGTGVVRIDGTSGIDIESGSISIKNSGSVSNVKLYCESGNSHYTQLQSTAHANYSGNITLTLPSSTGNLIGTGDSGTVTNTMLAGSIANGKLSNSSLTVTAGNGLSGGGSVSLGGTSTLALDLDELTAATVAVQFDSIAFIDASDANSTKKESISDLASAMAGTGIDANNGQFAIDSTVTTLTGVQTLTNKTLSSPVLNAGVSGTAILDEDNMASNSATKLATQQSIKAYVDAQVAGGGLNIDGYNAHGSSTIHQTQDHFVFSDNGTETKISFSNLEDAIFGNVSGDASIAAGGALTVAADAITYAKIQNVTATDKILGRSTSGAGIVEEIACTAAGRALLDDADAAAQRTTLGLAIGTNVQAYNADLAAIAGLTSAADKGIQFTGSGTAATYDLTAAGKALLDDANAAAQRTTLGLGDVSTLSVGISNTNVLQANANIADNDFLRVDGTSIEGRTAAEVLSDIGAQASDVGLTSIAGLTTAADKMIYTTGSDTYTVTSLTAAGRALLDDANAAAQRVTLGVGTSDSPTFAGATAGNIKVGVTGDNEIDTSSGNLTLDSAGGTVAIDDNLTVSGNAAITGNLTVSGTTTTLNSEVALADRFMMLNSNYTTNAALDGGIVVNVDPSATVYDGSSIDINFNSTTTVQVAGDASSELAANKIFIIRNAEDAANNGLYQVHSSSHSSGTTTVTIKDASSNTPSASVSGIVNTSFTTNSDDDSAVIAKTKIAILKSDTANNVFEVGFGDDASSISYTDLATSGGGITGLSTNASDTLTIGANYNLIPNTAGSTDLGSASAEYGDVYIADDKMIKFGSDQDATIEYDEDGDNVLQIAGSHVRIGHGAATQLQFRDSAVHISSDADGYLNAQADTGITLNINGTDELALTASTATFGTNIVIPDAGTIGSASDTDALAISSGGVVSVSAVTDASSKTTGAVTIAGGLGVAKKLYVGTDLDVDGTANLDAVDIDGAVQIDNTVTVGVDDTGYDVKFFGATAGQYLLWDESADELVLAGDSKLSFNDAAGGENIVASADGHLEVNAGTTLDMTAPTVDINASTTVTLDTAVISIDGTDDSNLTVTGSAKDLDIAVAGGGTQELRLASAGTGASALHLNASAGGINIDAADMIDIDAADEITIDTTSADGHIAITSAHTAGDAILISANANAGSILNVDAGIMDVDVQGAYTLDATGISLDSDAAANFTTSSGALTLSGAGGVDINGGLGSTGVTISAAGAISADGRIVTDDTTNATSTTDGSIQTDGGLSVAQDAVIGDDLYLLSDASVIHFGADSEIKLTHVHNAGLSIDYGNSLTNVPYFQLISSDSGASGPALQFKKDGSSPADNDTVGRVDFVSEDDANNVTTYASMVTQIADASSGAEGGKLQLYVASHNGSLTSGLLLADGDAAGELDATIGAGASSTVTVPGGIKFTDSDASNYTILKAHATTTSDVTYTLPAADGSNGQFLKTNGSGVMSWAAAGGSPAADDITAGDAAVTLTTTTGNITIDAQANNSDIIFKGTDGGSDTTFLTLDGSDAGTAIFNSNIKIQSDSGAVHFGADGEIKLTHVHNSGLSVQYSHTAQLPTFELKNNSAETSGPTFILNKNGSSPADNDVIGSVDFISEDSASNVTTYARMRSQIADASSGAEGGKLDIYVASHDGTLTSGLNLTDGDAAGELDATIGAGASSTVTVPGGIKFTDSDASNYTIVKANATTTSDVTYTLPAADGSDGHFLKTNGSGVMSWAAAGGGSPAADDIAAGDAAVSIETTTGTITIDAQQQNQDIIFKGNNGSAYEMLRLDSSDGGTAIMSNNLKLRSDNALITLGANDEVRLSHLHNSGLKIELTSSDEGSYDPTLILETNSANNTYGPVLSFDHVGSDADDDYAGLIRFQARTSTNTNAQPFANILSQITDRTHTNKTAKIIFDTMSANSSTTAISIEGSTSDTNLTTKLNKFVDIADHNGTTGLKLGGTLVTATAAELNLLDVSTASNASSSTYLRGDGSWQSVSASSLPPEVKATTTSNFTVSLTPSNASTFNDLEVIYAVSNGSTAVTATLPTAASIEGKKVHVKRLGTANVTVDGHSSETIDGSATFVLTTQYSSVTMISDGTNWIII